MRGANAPPSTSKKGGKMCNVSEELLKSLSISEIVDSRNEEVLFLNDLFRQLGIKYQIVYDEIPSKRKWTNLIKYNEKAQLLPPYYLLFRPLREIKKILKEKLRYNKSIE